MAKNLKPRRSRYGFWLYPLYKQNGRLVWVTVPERDAEPPLVDQGDAEAHGWTSPEPGEPAGPEDVLAPAAARPAGAAARAWPSAL